MSKRTIPARTINVCDCCGVTDEDGIRRFVMECRVQVFKHALDYQGSPVANGGWIWDLCDTCATRITNDMLMSQKRLQEPKP